MSIQTTLQIHVSPVEVRVRYYVVSWLANANGFPVTKDQMANAFYIKTEMHETADDALAHWDEICEADPAFCSCQDWTGESIV